MEFAHANPLNFNDQIQTLAQNAVQTNKEVAELKEDLRINTEILTPIESDIEQLKNEANINKSIIENLERKFNAQESFNKELESRLNAQDIAIEEIKT